MKNSCHLWSTLSWNTLSTVCSVECVMKRLSWEPNCAWQGTPSGATAHHTNTQMLAEADSDDGPS